MTIDNSQPTIPSTTSSLSGGKSDGKSGRVSRFNGIGMSSMGLFVLVLVWQAYTTYQSPREFAGGSETMAQIVMLISVIGGLAAAVMGFVGLLQRRRPGWFSVVGITGGLCVVVLVLAGWFGSLVS